MLEKIKAAVLHNGTNVLLNAISSLILAITIIYYIIYVSINQYFDLIGFYGLLLGLVCSLLYVFTKYRFTNFISVICLSVGLGVTFLNSFPVFADRLNDIDMYGGRGSLGAILVLLILILIPLCIEGVSCFMKDPVSQTDKEAK